MKSVQPKHTICSLKTISLNDFGEDKVEIFEVAEYIKDLLIENQDPLIFDPETEDIRENWPEVLAQFIEENL